MSLFSLDFSDINQLAYIDMGGTIRELAMTWHILLSYCQFNEISHVKLVAPIKQLYHLSVLTPTGGIFR